MCLELWRVPIRHVERGLLHHIQDGDRPLHLAARHGHTQVIAQLLKAGAFVHAANDKGMTALHRAAAKGHAQAVGELLYQRADAGADFRAQSCVSKFQCTLTCRLIQSMLPGQSLVS